jgi:hypothetical protein
MPRETIVNGESIEHPAIAGSEETPPQEAHTETKLGLSMGWNRAGWVQLHMVPSEAEHTGEWYIVDMDRPALNRLIAAARKARNGAYGRDE